MRKTFLLSLLLVILYFPAMALEVKGKVISQDGAPISNVVVLHRLSQKKTETDREGYFRLEIEYREKVRLEIIHPDYMEQEIILFPEDYQKEIIVRLASHVRQREEVVVTALRYPEPSSSVPAAGTVITRESIEESMSPNLVQNLEGQPGMSSIGTGGFSIVPSIRGLTRRRVLIMIDNARITSDRRTGPSASFVNPSDIEKIEVLRSPSSVFYGSDAIGGVIHIFTRKPKAKKGLEKNISLKYGTVNQEKGFGISLESKGKKTGFYLSLRGADAENYSSPRGEILQSRFSTGSLFGKISFFSKKREIIISFLGARGLDIGKPNIDSSVKPTWYPVESQNLVQFHWLEKNVGTNGDLSFRLFFNPNYLETKKEKIISYKSRESFSRTQSLDFGFQVSYGKKIGDALRFQGGADIYGRLAVKAENLFTYFNVSGDVEKKIEEVPFSKGKRNDLGLFISFDYSGLKNFDLVGGLRFDFQGMEAKPGNSIFTKKNRYQAWTGFIGASARLSDVVVAFFNISRAYRAPSLGERFYTGITGRGYVIGKPDLRPETSFNLDLGIKFINRSYFAGVYYFFYRIDDMIERYRSSGNIYTYGNIERGEIQGLEIELEYFPVPGWKMFGNLYYLKGISLLTEIPLNDIPPLSVFLGTRAWKGHFWGEINCRIKAEKRNPGPAEISIPGYTVFNLHGGYVFNSRMRLFVSVSNLFNKTYFARPDPNSTEAPGRNLVLGLTYSF